MSSSLLLLVIGVMFLTLAIVMVFKPWYVAALPAYAGLWLLHWSCYTSFPSWVFIFYGVATLMVMGIRYLSPKGEPDGKTTGNLYLGLGAMMGCMLGMLLEARFMVLGTILAILFSGYITNWTLLFSLLAALVPLSWLAVFLTVGEIKQIEN